VVTFIHDLIPIEFPEYVRPPDKIKHLERINNALRYSRGIVVNSICTETSLVEHARKAGLPAPPILVARPGHTLPTAKVEAAPSDIASPYFLFLGTIEPRKNHLLILTVWRELVKRLGPATPKLVVVGRRGWECEQIIDLLDRCEALHPHIIELNEESDERVASLVRGARALLLPSFAEGFGLPVQEALAAGTPVIASPLPAFLEIAGEIPEYAEPFDGVRWLHLIMDYALPESKLRRNQIERIGFFRETTWESHFKKIEEFLRAVG
jgi:glycosyltransferase involved in cell wall biosynthesis